MGKSNEDLERTHIWLYKEDVEWVKQTFSQTIGYSEAIRMMVRKFRKHIEAKAAEQATALPVDQSDILNS